MKEITSKDIIKGIISIVLIFGISLYVGGYLIGFGVFLFKEHISKLSPLLQVFVLLGVIGLCGIIGGFIETFHPNFQIYKFFTRRREIFSESKNEKHDA